MLTKSKKSIKNHPLVWKHYRNRDAFSSYEQKALDDVSQSALLELKKNGIAFLMN